MLIFQEPDHQAEGDGVQPVYPAGLEHCVPHDLRHDRPLLLHPTLHRPPGQLLPRRQSGQHGGCLRQGQGVVRQM